MTAILNNIMLEFYEWIFSFNSNQSCNYISGNILALICAAKNPSLRKGSNKFILNLAVSDFFICTWTMPTVVIAVIRREWTLGDLGTFK